MTIYGLNDQQTTDIATRLGLVPTNVRTSGRGVALKLEPPDSDHRYARTSGRGRRLKACSYEAFRDFILSCFASGATRIKSAQGDWKDGDSFRQGLDAMRSLNVGSMMEPSYMGNLSNEAVPETIVTI